MSHNEARQRQAGFSLLEALVSLGLFLVVTAVVLSLYAPSRLIYVRGVRLTDVQQNARLAMGEMTRGVRMAGYFPENFVEPAPATPIADPFLVATDVALAIHGDADGSGASNVFMYCLDGTDLRRTRAAKTAPGAYACSGGELLAENVRDLRFTYYDADGNPLPDPPSAPFRLDDQDVGAVPALDDTSLRSAVRRVAITLTTELESPQRGPQTFSLTSDAWIRNGS